MKSLKVQKFKSLSLAALLIASVTFVACSSDDESIEQPTNGKYTMTIQATKGSDATTRALEIGRNSDDTKNSLNATWDEGEIVEVYQSGSKIGELTAAASADASTTLTGTFGSAPSATADLTFYFHTASSPSYTGQDGTLETIATTYDFCAPATVTTGNFTVDDVNKKITVPGGISFGANQQAIVKFTLKQSGDVALSSNPTALDINYGTGMVSLTDIPAATYTTNGDGVLYVAIPNVSDGIIGLTAIAGSDYYIYSKSSISLQAGKYYEIKVKMTPATVVDLSKVSSNTTLTDGQVAIGTLGGNYKISIANNATVTLHNATINGVSNWSYKWAGITCDGNADIILSGNNTVRGFSPSHPGIQPGWTGTTLIIGGTGSLKVSSNGYGAGIGCDNSSSTQCGNITITGGTITATGGSYSQGAGIGSSYGNHCGDITITGGIVTAYGGRYAAGIGTGNGEEGPDIEQENDEFGVCGTITISGGTVAATGGDYAAGIGTGWIGNCGTVTITSGVTSVTATKGWGAQHSIGRGSDNHGESGHFASHSKVDFDVYIGGSKVGYIGTSPYTYQP